MPLIATALWATPLHGQIPRGEIDTTRVVVDSSDVVSLARAAQDRFERRRVRLLPLSYGPFGGSCDEVVGRICTTYGEGEWYPQPEDPEISALRRALIVELDSLQALVPSDPWILGQRVWYRAEGDDWAGALRAARGCGAVLSAESVSEAPGSFAAPPRAPPPPAAEPDWWCLALEGFALHGLGRYTRSEAAFERALTTMDEERGGRWRLPRWPVDGDVRELLEDAVEEEARSTGPGRNPFEAARLGRQGAAREPAERTLLRRLWTLADPLWLVDGNDRLTAHYARWTFTVLRGRARNPFRLSWGDDLAELTVRHGWQVGWERTPARDFSGIDNVIGHNHPLGRDYMPDGEILEAPARAAGEDVRPDVDRPRSLYAPRYAPVLLPMEGQLAVFPRGATTAFVATHSLPEDTTFHADHRHPLPWLEPGDQAGMPDRTGLFAWKLEPLRDHLAGSWPVDTLRTASPRTASAVDERPTGRRLSSPEPRGVETLHRVEGASILEVPTGDYVVSAESWSPALRRAGRLRLGVPARSAPDDVATLSDIILLRPADVEPGSLEGAVDLALPAARVRPGQRFAIGWEVAGLGFRPETLVFEVSVERADRSVLSRIGDFLGLGDPPRPLTLSWEEPGPGEPRHAFRYLALDLPALEEGEYEIRLVLRTSGRTDAVTTKRFEVVAPR